jgi:tetratricopeptide (TPR) repeat protein
MWSRRSIELLIGATVLVAVAGCSVTPKRAAAPVVAQSAAAAKSGPPPMSAEATRDFDQALALARAGNDEAARAQLMSLARQYPQFCTPLVNLGILYRKSGDLDAAAHALQQAVARDPHSAPAWTELGVTQRLGGKFQDAEQSYGRAIAVDPSYAPAYRDRGVLRDLYLGQPAAALGDFEQYRKLAGQDKPVVMWIAELQHRIGIKEPRGAPSPVSAATVPPVATQTRN